MKVLVTGGSGFIGRNLAEVLGGQYAVVAPASAELNLLDAPAVRSYLCAHHFDIIVNAATTRSNRHLGARADLLDRNCRMFFNLVRNPGLFGKMIHFGSGAEYQRAGLPPRVGEDYFDAQVPTDPYGFSKYICAKHIERSERLVELRLFGVFGKYEDWEVRFISNACCRAMHGLPITLRQDLKFDYLYIEDLARITAWFIENDAGAKAYNVCSGSGYMLAELAQMVAEVSGHAPSIVVKQGGLGPEYTADNARLLAAIGGYRFADMRSSIAKLYSWYAAHRDIIKAEKLHFDD